MYFAHSTSDTSPLGWEPLHQHLKAVGALAEQYGRALGLSGMCAVAGQFHDLGKYNPAFQRRLSGSPERVDHSTAGAAMVLKQATQEDTVFAELIAYAIAGHHAGLPDKRGLVGASLVERLETFSESNIDPIWRNEIATDLGALRPTKDWRSDRVGFQLALMGRMVFSALVDADFKATEAFYAQEHGPQPERSWPALVDRLDGMIAALDARLARLADMDSPVIRLRGEIVAQVRGKAASAPGLYTLTVPTGGGKTLTSLAFALDHARTHSMGRVIYAIPYTAIIDQTASQFRALFGDDIVLEHHTGVERQDPETVPMADSNSASKEKLRLAMEDWAAPLVVTTNVQLFESLFASRTSSARKLHNIANSVIVLDEAQTLPRPLLLPILRTIEALARDYGCTIILCTATQPAFDQRQLEGGLDLAGRELAPDPALLARRLRRVVLRDVGPLADADLVAELGEAQQGLVVVNSRKHALALYTAAKTAELDGLIHLSTRMCAAHRRPLFEVIKSRLEHKLPCRVISTSLIEAGVDVDFPRVWRAQAGLDQIAQAAGRCNREGSRPVAESIVTVFEAPDNPPPGELKQLSDARKRMQHKFADLFSPDAMSAYFREVYWQLGTERLDRGRIDRQPILEKFALEGGSTEFAYRSAAENFRMIESGMLPVIVPFDERAKRAIEQLGVEAISSGRLARDLQTYIVQVPPQARQKLIASGRARVESPRLRADQFVVLTDQSLYREDIGLVWEDAEYLGTEALMQM